MYENRAFITYKPIFESSNAFLGRFKRMMQVKKAGFSGTLDPFAKGVLLVATGSYTRLFSHFHMPYKTYQATLWLGVQSASLDIENIFSIQTVPAYHEDQIRDVLSGLLGDVVYTPPSFSAKKVNGKRAYALARQGENVCLEPVRMCVKEIHLVHYCHPFITFKVAVSKGGYVRSLGQMIAKTLGTCGVLSSLERLCEGDVSFYNPYFFKHSSQQGSHPILFQELDVLKMLPYERLNLPHLKDIFLKGGKMKKNQLNIKSMGRFIVEFEDFFSIIEVEETDVVYLLNRIVKC